MTSAGRHQHGGDEKPQQTPIKVVMAPGISPDSWLNEPRFEAFKRGYEYAQNATMAIEPLSKLTPEEAYWLYSIIEHGIAFTSHNDQAGAS